MKFLELFAGAGGASLGIHAAGCTSIGIEWDAAAVATAQAAGHDTRQGDVRDLSIVAGETFDAIWSSFPCQAWSSAGKRLGAQDERNGWPWTVDAIDAIRPRWVVCENVTGLLQHGGCPDSGCKGPKECPRAYFDRVILAQLRERFAWVGYRVLDSASFGVPQFRKRVIIVAGPHAIDWPKPTHGKPSGQADLFGRSLKPWVTVRDALGLSERVIGGGTRGHGMAEWRPRDCTDEPAPAVNAMQGSTAGIYAITQRMRGAVSSATTEPAMSATGKGTIYTADRAGEVWASSQPERLDRPSPTVSAVGEQKGSGEGGNPQKMQRASDALFLATGRRRLTVEECAALQDFPAGYPWQGNKSERYRQVGNSVPPTLARVVVAAVVAADR